jgi:anti-anti-sigma factor
MRDQHRSAAAKTCPPEGTSGVLGHAAGDQPADPAVTSSDMSESLRALDACSGRVCTLALVGELDRASAPALEMEIERLCEAGAAGVTLDLRGLTGIDWTGAKVIAFRSRLCRSRGFEFALIPGPRFVQRAFAQAGADEALEFIEADGTDAELAPAGTARARSSEQRLQLSGRAAGCGGGALEL